MSSHSWITSILLVPCNHQIFGKVLKKLFYPSHNISVCGKIVRKIMEVSVWNIKLFDWQTRLIMRCLQMGGDASVNQMWRGLKYQKTLLFPRTWGGALRDETKNGCVGDYSNSGVWVLALQFLVLHLASARFCLRLDSAESQASPSISPVQFLSFCCLISVHLIYCNIWRRNRLVIHRHTSRVMCFLWHMLHIYSWCFVTSQWPLFSLPNRLSTFSQMLSKKSFSSE